MSFSIDQLRQPEFTIDPKEWPALLKAEAKTAAQIFLFTFAAGDVVGFIVNSFQGLTPFAIIAFGMTTGCIAEVCYACFLKFKHHYLGPITEHILAVHEAAAAALADRDQHAEQLVQYEAIGRKLKAHLGEGLYQLAGSPDRQDELITMYDRHSLRIREKLYQLLRKPPLSAKYRDQLEIADLLSRSSTARFWATCLDRPSRFQERNYYYCETLNELPAVANRASASSVRRAFVGLPQQFVADIVNPHSAVMFLDLYAWHLRWGRKAGANEEVIRFYSYDVHAPYRDLFSAFKIHGDLVIEDFMLVDKTFVYGRTYGHEGEEVFLSLLREPATLEGYEGLFAALWGQACEIDKLCEQVLIPQYPTEEARIKAFGVQCHKRKTKLNIPEDYGTLFLPNQRRGTGFFDRVVWNLRQGQGECFAVDSADSKRGSLWDTWHLHPYNRFREASKAAAARPGCNFRRLFLIESWPGETERDKCCKFFEEFVGESMQLQFLGRADAKLLKLPAELDTDFIIVGTQVSQNDVVDARDAFGFELQRDAFEVERLDWQDHLIARAWIENYYTGFTGLWENEACVVGPAGVKDIDRVISELIAKGAKV